ncbi:hypothetical protein V2J09_006033 [Rumex salicifolius]
MVRNDNSESGDSDMLSVKLDSHTDSRIPDSGTLHVNGFDYKSDSDCVKVSKGDMTVMKGQITVGRVYRLIGSTIEGGAAAAVSKSNNTPYAQGVHRRAWPD